MSRVRGAHDVERGYGRNLWVAEGPDTAHVRMVQASAHGVHARILDPSRWPRRSLPPMGREKAVQEHKRGKRVRIRRVGCAPTLSRWIRAFKPKGKNRGGHAAILVACRQKAAEARETLAELVGERAGRWVSSQMQVGVKSDERPVVLRKARPCDLERPIAVTATRWTSWLDLSGICLMRRQTGEGEMKKEDDRTNRLWRVWLLPRLRSRA